MKILLAACNAKYIHSNLAVYTLQASAEKAGVFPEIREFTINQSKDSMLRSLFLARADVVCVSCYIWNISIVEDLITEYHKISPKTKIWLGGPEVSYHAEEMLEQYPFLAGIMKGEGEVTFREIAVYYQNQGNGMEGKTLEVKNSQFNYQNKAPFDKTVAVTSIIDDGNRFFERDDEENESLMKATDRGTLVHLFLELYPLDKELNFEECFQNIIQRSLFNEEARTLLNQYKVHLESFIESDVYQLMLKSSYCYKEKEFSFLNENKQIIHGIFDVLCINEDKITIIDYKTDTLAKNSSDELLKELHQGQMYYYKKIMKQMFPNKEVEAIVYYLHIHRYVTL